MGSLLISGKGRMTRLAVLSAILAFGIAMEKLEAAGAAIGEPAPPLNLGKLLQAPDQAEASWEALRGKVVVLDFWATWCGPCVASIPHWNELASHFRDKPVVFLAISDENEAVVTSFLKRRPIDSWVGLEGISQSTRERYGVRGIPVTFLVNQEGIIVATLHPQRLKSEHIDEVLKTGRSSIPPPSPAPAEDDREETVDVDQEPPLFEASIRRSRPRVPGRGYNLWSFGSDRREVRGMNASVRSAIAQCYQVRESILRPRTELPEADYDFTFRIPEGGQQTLEQLFAIALRQTFGLVARRDVEEQEVLILSTVRTDAPGLEPFDPSIRGPIGGSSGPGMLQFGGSTLDGLLSFLESLLGRPVVNETGLTNRYNIRMQWDMTEAELLITEIDPKVLQAAFLPQRDGEEADALKQLPESQRSFVAAIKGELAPAELSRLDLETRRRATVLRNEWAKPEAERFRPAREAIERALEEQLGLKLTPGKRKVDVLVIEAVEDSGD